MRTSAWILRYNHDIRNFIEMTLPNVFYREKVNLQRSKLMQQYEENQIGMVFPFELPVFSYRTRSLIPSVIQNKSAAIIQVEQ